MLYIQILCSTIPPLLVNVLCKKKGLYSDFRYILSLSGQPKYKMDKFFINRHLDFRRDLFSKKFVFNEFIKLVVKLYV